MIDLMKTTARRAATTALWVSALAGVPALAQEGPQQLPTVTLGITFHTIKAEVAVTPKQHEIGLMHRTSMGPNDGMIFIFEQAGQQCFWMKNTLIPLSVAFIADDGTIVNLDEMKPETLQPHCSVKPVRYVLEMNKGWFSKRGLKAGTKVTGQPFNTAR